MFSFHQFKKNYLDSHGWVKAGLLIGSLSSFAGYNHHLSLYNMHFLHSEVINYVDKGVVDPLSFKFNEDGDFQALGMTFQTTHPTRKDYKLDYMWMSHENSIRTLVNIPKAQHELEQNWKKSLVYIVNKRSMGSGLPMTTIGTGFYIHPDFIITNAHVYRDDHHGDSSYANLGKNKDIYFINQFGNGSSALHARIFCSDIDYCIIHAPKIAKNSHFLEFETEPKYDHPVKASNPNPQDMENPSLLGYPGLLFRQFFANWPKDPYESLMSSSGIGIYRLNEFINYYPEDFGKDGTYQDWDQAGKKIGLKYSYADKLFIYFAPSFGGTSGGPVVGKNGKVLGINFYGSNLSTKSSNKSHGHTLAIDSKFVLADIYSKCLSNEHQKQNSADSFAKNRGIQFCQFIKTKYIDEMKKRTSADKK